MQAKAVEDNGRTTVEDDNIEQSSLDYIESSTEVSAIYRDSIHQGIEADIFYEKDSSQDND